MYEHNSWVTGRVWPYVLQRSEAGKHAVLRQLVLNIVLAFFNYFCSHIFDNCIHRSSRHEIVLKLVLSVR